MSAFLGSCDRCDQTTTVREVPGTAAPLRAPDQECVDRAACDARLLTRLRGA